MDKEIGSFIFGMGAVGSALARAILSDHLGGIHLCRIKVAAPTDFQNPSLEIEERSSVVDQQ